MKKSLQLFSLLLALLTPIVAYADYVQLDEGVYRNGAALYISSSVASLDALQVDPNIIYCYSAIPPLCVSNTFIGYGATLHVPATSLSSYFIAEYWGNFANIVGDAVELTNIDIGQDSIEVSIGTGLSMTATITPDNATPKDIAWLSTNTAIATVSNYGDYCRVNAVGVGECDIIAQCLDKRAICHMVVNDTVITITLDKQEAKVLPNHTLILNPGAYPIMVDGFVVSSSNPNVAVARIMDGKVQVVGIKEGTTLITVGSTDGTAIPATCLVTVYTEVGDMNCDGYVNISDVTNLIDFLLTDNQEGISIDNADTNKDGHVNISDVTQLIDYLLTGLWPWDYETFTVNGVTFKMIAVEGGTFTMGYRGSDAYNYEYPTHQVTLSSYSIGQTEVTQALWLAVMGYNPSLFTESNGYTDDLQRPVEQVSWNDCQTFITKLNQLTGQNFRLPTEAEWEFAARGGNKSLGYKYAGSNNINEVAWWGNGYGGNSGYGTNKVATKLPNELCLYDMSGNVWEWCQDRFASYTSDSQTDPVGPSTGQGRVIRSGSWYGGAGSCRVSYRVYNWQTGKDKQTGLRLAL